MALNSNFKHLIKNKKYSLYQKLCYLKVSSGISIGPSIGHNLDLGTSQMPLRHTPQLHLLHPHQPQPGLLGSHYQYATPNLTHGFHLDSNSIPQPSSPPTAP